MAAHENVNKYQFHELEYSPTNTRYFAYKGDKEVGDMSVWHDPYKGEAMVGGMFLTPEHRHVAPTMLGVAATKMAAQGMKLVPSDDLSPHSSKLVQGMQERGLVTSTRLSEIRNSSDWSISRHVEPESRRGQRLNTEEVNEGRTFIREKIRKRRDAS